MGKYEKRRKEVMAIRKKMYEERNDKLNEIRH